MRYQGSCHCGRVVLEIKGDITQLTDCNCSICLRKGALLWFVPRRQLRLVTSEADLGRYAFGNHTIHHRFCPVCGMHPYSEGIDPAGQAMAAVNVRCLEGVDLASFPVQHFDGRALRRIELKNEFFNKLLGRTLGPQCVPSATILV